MYQVEFSEAGIVRSKRSISSSPGFNRMTQIECFAAPNSRALNISKKTRITTTFRPCQEKVTRAAFFPIIVDAHEIRLVRAAGRACVSDCIRKYLRLGW